MRHPKDGAGDAPCTCHAARLAKLSQTTPLRPHFIPPLPSRPFAAHNQHEEFARLDEAVRNATITEEDRIKLDKWKGALSRGGALCWG